ncbi:MAG: hypothetical protein AAB669_00260 [Patescibacteria group bacterium]
MENIHVVNKKLGKGEVRLECGEILRTPHRRTIDDLPSLDGEGVCLDCRRQWNKEVLNHSPEYVTGTIVKRPFAAAA